MNKTIIELLEEVNDEASFLRFVESLVKDQELNQSEWQNNSIGSFLEAAYAWSIDSDFGSTQDLSNASLWKKFATFLYCGKIYE